MCVRVSYVRCECDMWGCVRQRRVIIRTATSGRAVPLGSSGCRGAPRSATAVRGGMAQFKDQVYYLGILNPQPAQVSTCVMSSVQRPHGPSEPEGQGGGYCILYGEWKE